MHYMHDDLEDPLFQKLMKNIKKVEKMEEQIKKKWDECSVITRIDLLMLLQLPTYLAAFSWIELPFDTQKVLLKEYEKINR